jgi:glycosyltransferase involved in cell wall biosynthesis
MNDSAAAIEPFVPRDRWRILPNGLDFSSFGLQHSQRQVLREQWGLRDDAIALGIACAISARKRVDHFIRLVASLRESGVPAYGFIAGQPYFAEDHAVLDALHRLAAELRVDDYVRFLGYVEPSEPLYHAWDLCISTSAYETFGMTVLEAMACDCAVVTYPGGSVAEIVGDGAIVIPDEDFPALLAATLQLCRNREARARLAEKGRRHAETTYDMRRIVPLLAREYRALAAGAPVSR